MTREKLIQERRDAKAQGWSNATRRDISKSRISPIVAVPLRSSAAVGAASVVIACGGGRMSRLPDVSAIDAAPYALVNGNVANVRGILLAVKEGVVLRR